MDLFQIAADHSGALLGGLGVTLRLCVIVWTTGILLGTLIGYAGSRWKRLVGLPSKLISVVLAATPILVFLFWLHYPLQEIFSVVIDPFVTAACALCIVNTFLVADLCRGVISDFPAQYEAAAKVCGMSTKEILFSVTLPIILRQILPSLLLIQITMLQATLFASLISVPEIFRTAQRINSQIYRPVEIYSMLALFFLLVCIPLHGLASYLRSRFTRDLSES